MLYTCTDMHFMNTHIDEIFEFYSTYLSNFCAFHNAYFQQVLDLLWQIIFDSSSLEKRLLHQLLLLQ